MSVIKLTPKNLAGIQRHFEREKYNTEKKLNSAKKSVKKLEAELEVYNDGLEWTIEVYKSSKTKRED